MRRSIRLRLLVWIMALVIPLSAAAGWLLVQVFASRLLRDVDVAIGEEAETVALMLGRANNAETITALVEHVAAERDYGVGREVVVVQGGQVIAEAPPGARTRLAGSTDPAFRIATYEASTGGMRVTVGVRATAALHAKQRLTLILALGLPGALVLLGAGLWGVIGRALQPLEEAARQVAAITGDNPSARVRVATSDDEVGRMVAVLNQMLARLEASVTELRRFTADAAHELRTPLTVLRTGLDVALTRERPAAEYRAALEDALTGTDHLIRLAEDLLTLARMDAEAEAEPSLVDLAEMLHELGDAWAPLCEKREITLRVEAAPGFSVRGGAVDLYRLFNNLLDNAVAHSPRGGQVLVAAKPAAPWVRVTVADQGPGIDDDEAPRVFDRFYRGSRSRAKGVGSGLGLSIARKIVALYGGQIALANGTRGGCVVEVSLSLST